MATADARAVPAADVYGRLRRAVRDAGSQKAFADAVGVSPQFLNAVLTARSRPSDAILAAVGIKRVVYYAEVES